MITVNELTIGYHKSTPIISNLNYTFDKKVYGILGNSGKGKTTFLRTISGLLMPLSGTVMHDGKVVNQAYKNDIYMMHQNYSNFDWLKCIDNVLISKKIKGKKITEIDINNANDILKIVGLNHCVNKYPSQLSGGMNQRLALARTLFTKPSVILMDEPLSALDKDTRNVMQQLILNIHNETNNTIILITHSEEEANKMCDEIIKF